MKEPHDMTQAELSAEASKAHARFEAALAPSAAQKEKRSLVDMSLEELEALARATRARRKAAADEREAKRRQVDMEEARTEYETKALLQDIEFNRQSKTYQLSAAKVGKAKSGAVRLSVQASSAVYALLRDYARDNYDKERAADALLDVVQIGLASLEKSGHPRA